MKQKQKKLLAVPSKMHGLDQVKSKRNYLYWNWCNASSSVSGGNSCNCSSMNPRDDLNEQTLKETTSRYMFCLSTKSN